MFPPSTFRKGYRAGANIYSQTRLTVRSFYFTKNPHGQKKTLADRSGRYKTYYCIAKKMSKVIAPLSAQVIQTGMSVFIGVGLWLLPLKRGIA